MPADASVYRALTQEELGELASTNASLTGIEFAPPLSLDDVDLSETQFERCLFRLPAIRSANFSGCVFKDCRLEPSRFANCKLAMARFEGCTLFDVAQKKGCTFAFCDLHGAELTKSNLATSAFERCDLHDLRAVDCSLRGAQFRYSTFAKALSRRTVITKASFTNCNLSFADLSGLSLQNCDFVSCRLSEASFIDSDLSHARMLSCALDRVEWDRAKLGHADLQGSQLSGLNLAVLADYAGLIVSASEQTELLRQLGIAVRAEAGPSRS